MGNATQKTFISIEEQAAALESFDESTQSIEELNAIQDAEIVSQKADPEKPEETPASEKPSEPEKPPETPAEVPVEPTEKPVTPKQEADPPPKKWDVNEGDLPDGYDTPGKVFKTVSHQKETLERQAALIKRQDEQMEALRQKHESQPVAPVVPVAPKQPDAPVDYDAQITGLQTKLVEARKEDPFSEDAFNLQTQIDQTKDKKWETKFEAIQKTTETANNNFTEYKESRQQDVLNEKNQQTLKKDYEEIDALGKEKGFEEYVLTKSAKEVEKDYVVLKDSVVSAYYGRPPVSYQEENYAMQMYKNKAPDLLNKLQATQIPTEFTQDITNFLEAAKMLNVRDGVYYDDNGKQQVYRSRYDPATQQNIPDRFSNLKQAVEHQRLDSGHYRKKEISAYDKGQADLKNAQEKRDHNELGPDEGKQVVGNMTLDQMIAERDALDESKPESLQRLQELNAKIEQLLTTAT